MSESIEEQLRNLAEQAMSDSITQDSFKGSSVQGASGVFHKILPGLTTGRDLPQLLLDTLNDESPHYVGSPSSVYAAGENIFQEFEGTPFAKKSPKRSPDPFSRYVPLEGEVGAGEERISEPDFNRGIKLLNTKVVVTGESIHIFSSDIRYKAGTMCYQDWSHATTIDFEDVVEVFHGSVCTGGTSSANMFRLQIVTKRQKILFERPTYQDRPKDFDVPDVAKYIATEAGLDTSYPVEGRVNQEIVKKDKHPRKSWDQSFPFERGWGIEKRTWENDVDKSHGSEIETEQRQEMEESRKAHVEATKKQPPVEIGHKDRMGIIDFDTHHSGERQPVGEIQGFKIFVTNAPEKLEIGDIIEIKIMSYNPGKTSAKAIYVES